MAALSPDRVIVLDNYLDVSTVDVVDMGTGARAVAEGWRCRTVYAALKDKHPHLAVYRRNEIPADYGLAGHPRLPAVIGIADEGWNIASERIVQRWRDSDRHPPRGTHGYDGAAAIDARPLRGRRARASRADMMVKPFENIHIYEFMCAVLGLHRRRTTAIHR